MHFVSLTSSGPTLQTEGHVDQAGMLRGSPRGFRGEVRSFLLRLVGASTSNHHAAEGELERVLVASVMEELQRAEGRCGPPPGPAPAAL